MGTNHDPPVVHATQTRKTSSPTVHSPFGVAESRTCGKELWTLFACMKPSVIRLMAANFSLLAGRNWVLSSHSSMGEFVFKEQLKFPWKEIKCLVLIKMFCTLFKHIPNRMMLMVHPLMRFLPLFFYSIYPKGMTLRKDWGFNQFLPLLLELFYLHLWF